MKWTDFIPLYIFIIGLCFVAIYISFNYDPEALDICNEASIFCEEDYEQEQLEGNGEESSDILWYTTDPVIGDE